MRGGVTMTGGVTERWGLCVGEIHERGVSHGGVLVHTDVGSVILRKGPAEGEGSH